MLTLDDDILVVDLIRAANLWSEPHGVLRILGRCINDTAGREPEITDWAYRLSERAQVSLSTSEYFPDGFPSDFSVLIVARPTPGKILRL